MNQSVAIAARLDALFSLRGHHALVTGGSSGLGEEIACALASAGADVTLVGRDQQKLDAVAQRITDLGQNATTCAANLISNDGVATVLACAANSKRPVDILVNAAGVNLRAEADRVTRDDWNATLQLNLTVPFFLAQGLVPAMLSDGWGRVINIGSLQSIRAFPNSSAYGASKGGIVQLTRHMAEAWSKGGVCCNAISPGLFRTPLTEAQFIDDDGAAAKAVAARTCVGRNGEATDIRGLAIYLASPASAFMTGQTLYLCGGLTAR